MRLRDAQEFIGGGQIARMRAAVKPENPPAAGNERGAGKLQDVAAFEQRAAHVVAAPGSLSFLAAAQVVVREDERAPGSAREAHSAVAFFIRVGDAAAGKAVARAEPFGLLRRALHHAHQPHAQRIELRQPLAQLREYLRVKLSAKMSQPQHQRRPLRPAVSEAFLLALGGEIGKIGRHASNGNSRVRFMHHSWSHLEALSH